MSRDFRPIRDQVVLRRLDTEEETSGGIYVPDNARDKSQVFDVISVGPGRRWKDGKRHALDVRPGDRVVLGKYSGYDVTVEGRECTIVREEEVLAVIGRKVVPSIEEMRGSVEDVTGGLSLEAYMEDMRRAQKSIDRYPD